MTLRDILTRETYIKYGDMDVIDNVIDDSYPAWCGNLLTEKGQEHFKEALDVEACLAPVWGRIGIHCLIDGERWKKKRALILELFDSLAGFCDDKDYDEWFDDDWEYEPEEFHLLPEGDPDEDSLERIGKLEDMFSNAMDWIFDHIKQEGIRDMMEHVGYSQEEIDQYYKEFMQ